MSDVGCGGTGGFERPELFLFHESKCVFQNDQRIIDDDTDHEDQRQHRHTIQGEV